MIESPATEPTDAPQRWPAEWERHAATWLSWPHNRDTWPTNLDGADRAFAEIAAALVPSERVRIVAKPTHSPRTLEALGKAGVDLERVDWLLCPTNDAWIRDHGPIFAVGRAGCAVFDFGFDNWGRKYPAWELDDAVPSEIAEFLDIRRVGVPFVLEGGSIDGDGAGTVLTTESCLLHPNRRGTGSPRTRELCQRVLEESLRTEALIWLAGGIEGDDTDGHVDDVARFVARGRVIAVRSKSRGDPDFAVLEENWSRLRAARDAGGRRLELTPLPAPPPRHCDGARLPASYANFYLANDVVLVPTFGVSTDEAALRVLADALPERRVVPIRCNALVEGLGAIHCCTKEEPAVDFDPS